MALLRTPITSAGVPAGAVTDAQDDICIPGYPSSPTVAKPGSTAKRAGDVTATARNLPDLIYGKEEASSSNMTSTSPPSRSTRAGPLPFYGTGVRSVLVLYLTSSAAMWTEAPIPPEASVSFTGADRASPT